MMTIGPETTIERGRQRAHDSLREHKAMTDSNATDPNAYANPPQTLEDLRDLVSRIQTGDEKLALGSRTFRTLAQLVDAPRQAAVFSISELASSHGINASTLTRLAKRLGYGGFSEFQGVFRRHVAAGDDFYSERAGRLLAEQHDSNSSHSTLAEIANDEAANVAAMVETLDSAQLRATATALANARAIRIQGLRHFYSIACLMSYGLGMIRDDVSVLDSAGHGVAHSLAQMQPGDVLVAIGHAPYTRVTVDACVLAARYDLRIVAITDSFASPLAGPAETVLITPAGGRFFGNSTAACVILVEALLTMTAAELGQEAVEALKKRERVIDELGVAMSAPVSIVKPT